MLGAAARRATAALIMLGEVVSAVAMCLPFQQGWAVGANVIVARNCDSSIYHNRLAMGKWDVSILSAQVPGCKAMARRLRAGAW